MTAALLTGDNVTASVRLLRPLAQGGMGMVWVAEHLDRQDLFSTPSP